MTRGDVNYLKDLKYCGCGLPFDLRNDTRSERWDIYKEARDSIQKNNVPEMSLDEINAKISAVRAVI